MKFSYTQVWNDAVELLRANTAIVTALAGVFLFLPALAIAYLLPMPLAERLDELPALLQEWLNANWHWLVLSQLVGLTGMAAILLLFLDARGRSVGVLISAAIMILPFLFLATLLMRIAVGIGLLLLIVPGIYLLGRLILTGPAVVVENVRNPLAALSRSFALTKGRGWAVAGLFVLVAIAGAIIIRVIVMLLGILFIAVAGQDVGGLLGQIVEAAAGAALSTVLLALVASMYGRLASPASAVAKAD